MKNKNTSYSNKNFLIIGHTGTGKTALLNYVFGQTVAKSAAGRPVTKKGSWKSIRISSPFVDNETLTFFDSWGLEADLAPEWEQEIRKKLTANWNEEVICGVIFCLSYALRIQEFELRMLRLLMELGYKVLVVITHADAGNYNTLKANYHQRIETACVKYKSSYALVDACMVSMKKKVGSCTAFGKEKIIKKLDQFSTDNLFLIYCNQVDAVFGEITKEINVRIYRKNKLIESLENDQGWKKIKRVCFPRIPAPDWLNRFCLSGKNKINFGELLPEEIEKDLEELKQMVDNRLRTFSQGYLQVYNVSFTVKQVPWYVYVSDVLTLSNKRQILLGKEYINRLEKLRDEILHLQEQAKKEKRQVLLNLYNKK